MDNEDLLMDDIAVIESLKYEMISLVNRLKHRTVCGFLKSVDEALLEARCIAMEMCLDEILTPDWLRLQEAVGRDYPIPRSSGYTKFLTQPSLRVATNPATHEAMGAPL